MASYNIQSSLRPKARPTKEQDNKPAVGIGSRDKPEEKEEKSFFDTVSDWFTGAGANLTPEEQARENGATLYTLPEFDEATRRSAEESALYRMDMGITSSLVEGGDEAFREKLPDGTTYSPPKRPGLTFEEAEDALVTIPEPEPVTVQELDGGEGLMSPVNDSIVRVALNKNETNDDLSKASIETQVKDIVGSNIRAAGILGAFTKESGSNFDDLEESNYYSLTSAYNSWRDADVDTVLATLPEDVRARLVADYEAGIRTGGSASAADRQLLGNAMFDTKYEGGSDYRGRGLIHITHDYNYRAVGNAIGVDLVSNPELVNDPRYAVPAALAFLDLNGYFDEDTNITKNTLHNIVNRYSDNAVKNARWKAAQKYLKAWQDEAVETSPRPTARPES